MDSARLTDDHPVRQRALDPEGSFICEAPAGSGKTELLTQRVLTLLAGVDQPESVLAITFTRKAAAEMRERILRALVSADRAEPDDKHQQLTWKLACKVQNRDRTLEWNVLDNPGRLQIRTFDSLTHMLTRNLPLQASLGMDFMVSEDAEQLYRLAIKSLMTDLDAETVCSKHLQVLLTHLDNRYQILESLLKDMLAGRDVWLPVLMSSDFRSEEVRSRLEDSLHNIVTDKITGIKGMIPPECQAELCELIDFAVANLRREQIQSPICALNPTQLFNDTHDFNDRGMSAWDGLRELVLTKEGEFRKKLDRRCGFPVGQGKQEKTIFKEQKQRMATLLTRMEAVPDLAASLQECLTWPGVSFSESQWDLLQSLTVLLPHLVAHLQLIFRERGEVDFIEVSARAGQALGDPDMPTDLALRLDYRIQHILVDEFQDTSYTQVDLLERLTAGWQPDDGRTLFCVGDAMQSIYSFRGANVGLFLKCKTQGLGDIFLEPLQLTSNFRSQAALVNWCNRTFSTAFPVSNDITRGAVTYSPAQAFRPALAGDAVQTRIFPDSLPTDYWARDAVEVMQSAWREQPETTVAILVRNRNHAAAIVRALKKSGVPYRAVELELLAERSPVQDVLALTCSLLFPQDRIAGLAALRAPWCGLTLADLEVVANRQESQWILHQARCALDDMAAGLSTDGAGRLQRVLPILERAYQERERKPLRMWIEGTWVLLGGPAVLAGDGDLADVERFYELLDTLQQRGPVPSREYLEDALLKLYAAPDTNASNRLQIMTIHKSKGLEFDLVILPELQRIPRRLDKSLLLWQKRLSLSGEEQLVIGPVTAVGDDPDAIYRHLEYEKKIRQDMEACRLLYVACTRARKRLYLYARLKQDPDNKESLRPPPAGSLLRYIWPTVQPTVNVKCWSDDDIGVQFESSSPLTGGLSRMPSDWHLDALPAECLLQDYVPQYRFDNSPGKLPVFHYREDTARLYGTLVHEVMQSIGDRGLDWWRRQDLKRLKPKWVARLRSLGMPPQDVEWACGKAMEVLHQSLAHSRMEWIHSPTFLRHTEYPVSVTSNNDIVHYVIDLLLVDGPDAWVVDYKTSEPMTGQSRVEFMESEARTYRQAMRQYKLAVEGLGYRKVRCALYMVATGDWIEY